MNRLRHIAAGLGLAEPTTAPRGIDEFLPFLERMKGDGAVVVLKFDGQRTDDKDTGSYTAIVTSPAIAQGGFIRTDAKTLEEALQFVVDGYAAEVWKI